MKTKFTFYARTVACTVLLFSALVINSFTAKTYAQNNCTSSNVIFHETFGTGTTSTGCTDVITTALTYAPNGPLLNEGTYRVSNSTQQKAEWHASEDATPNDINGKMLVVNGTAKDFYRHQITQPGLEGGDYTAHLFLMNINTPITCGAELLVPNISLRLEYLSNTTNTWVAMGGGPISTGLILPSINATWLALDGTFNLPTDVSPVKSIRIVLADATVPGCGNDFVIDEITVSQCTESNPTPVTFLNINARQKGSGVSIDWSTSQEFNSKAFFVEKSADGNSNWSVVGSVNAAGNSSAVKNYNAFDPRPSSGVNFYRLMQTDIDGKFKYSKVVSIKLSFVKTGVSVLANPFHSTLTVDFSSSTNQLVSARLIDITGKQVAAEKWLINTGNTSRDFSSASRLQQGMYILTVSGANGEILYNNKVIKQ